MRRWPRAGLLGAALTTEDDFTGRPESQRAEAVLQREFLPLQRGDRPRVDEAVIVSSRELTAQDPGFARRLATLEDALHAAGAGEVVREPVSRDGHTALLLVALGGDVEPLVERVVAEDGRNGFRTHIVGTASIDADFDRAADEDLARGEGWGLALALVVLLAVFGTVAAALVPVAVALASIAVALAVVAVVGQGRAIPRCGRSASRSSRRTCSARATR